MKRSSGPAPRDTGEEERDIAGQTLFSLIAKLKGAHGTENHRPVVVEESNSDSAVEEQMRKERSKPARRTTVKIEPIPLALPMPDREAESPVLMAAQTSSRIVAKRAPKAQAQTRAQTQTQVAAAPKRPAAVAAPPPAPEEVPLSPNIQPLTMLAPQLREEIAANKVAIPHVLGAKTMREGILEEITQLYNDQIWQKRVKSMNHLFQMDLIELDTPLMHNGIAFRNPSGMDAIQTFFTGLPKNSVPAESLQNEMTYLYTIPLCGPEFNAYYLHKPRPNGLRPCVQGDKGECVCYQWYGFVMQEFETPIQAKSRLEKNGGIVDPNRRVGLCLICDRESSAKLQGSALVNDEMHPQDYIYQSHRNPVDEVGAYLRDDCLTIEGGIIYPILENCKGNYRYHRNGDHEWLTEDGYQRVTAADLPARQNF